MTFDPRDTPNQPTPAAPTGLPSPRVESPELQRWLEAMTQRVTNIERDTNRRLDDLPQTVTDAATRAVIDALNRPSVIDQIPGTVPNLATPPLALGPRVWFGVDTSFITWDNPAQQYVNHGQTRIFRNAGTNDFDQATQIGQAEFVLFVDTSVQPGTVYHYWLVLVSDTDVAGQPAYAGSGQLGEIGAGQLGDNILDNLLARHGILDTALIRKGDIFDLTINNVIESSNYQAGTAGWRITKQGNVDLNDANFRGNILSDLQSDVFANAIPTSWSDNLNDPPFLQNNRRLNGMSIDKITGHIWYLHHADNDLATGPYVLSRWDGMTEVETINVTIPSHVASLGQIDAMTYNPTTGTFFVLFTSDSGFARVFRIQEGVFNSSAFGTLIFAGTRATGLASDHRNNRLFLLVVTDGSAVFQVYSLDVNNPANPWDLSWRANSAPVFYTETDDFNIRQYDALDYDISRNAVVVGIKAGDGDQNAIMWHNGNAPIRIVSAPPAVAGISSVNVTADGNLQVRSGRTLNTVRHYTEGDDGLGWRIARNGDATFSAADIYGPLSAGTLESTLSWTELWFGDVEVKPSNPLNVPYHGGTGRLFDDFDMIVFLMAADITPIANRRWGITAIRTDQLEGDNINNLITVTSGTSHGEVASVRLRQGVASFRVEATDSVDEAFISQIWGVKVPGRRTTT